MIGILVISRYAAPPYPAAPDFPPSGGQNKTPRNTLFINGSAVSTGYCATELQRWQRRYKKWRRRRRTSPVGTVSQPIGKPFNGQAKGLLWLTCTSYAGCAHQPSGILESTAQVPVPIPTAPKGACTLKPQRGLSIKSKSTASAVLLPIFIPYDVQWLLSPVPRRGDGDGWGGS